MRPTAAELDGQLDDQEAVLDLLARAIAADSTIHVALVPEKLMASWGTMLTHHALTWEAVRNAYVEAGDRDCSRRWFLIMDWQNWVAMGADDHDVLRAPVRVEELDPVLM